MSVESHLLRKSDFAVLMGSTDGFRYLRRRSTTYKAILSAGAESISTSTDRKRAEGALVARERELQLIVDSIPGMVAVFAASGELEAVNNQVLQYFGGPFAQHKDWARIGHTHPEDTPRVAEAFSRSIASGEPFELETRARRHDGVYRWFHSRGTPLKDASGCVVRWYKLLVDIEDRKRAEQKLRQNEEDLHTILDAIRQAVTVLAADGTTLYANRVALEITGRTMDDIKNNTSFQTRYPPG